MAPTNNVEAGNRRLREGRSQHIKVKTGLLRFLSIFNIVFCCLSITLEASNPYVGQGFWGSSFHMISGILGYVASFRPTKQRLAFVLTFSLISILFGLIVCYSSMIGYNDCGVSDDVSDSVCETPRTLLALAVINVIAAIDSAIVALLVLVALRVASKETTPDTTSNLRETPSVPPAIINTPTPQPVSESPMRRTAVISPNGNVHIFHSNQAETDFLARLAIANELRRMAIANEMVQMARRRQQEEELPPSYEEVVANSEHPSPIPEPDPQTSEPASVL